jgi:hypothetical protein
MRSEALAILAFCAIAFGGLGYLFVSLTDGINEPASTRSASTNASEGAPPAGPVVDDGAIVLGSPSITTNNARDVISVDFFECLPGSSSLTFGETEVDFIMHGFDNGNCLVDYAAGDEAVACDVPATLGLVRFTLGEEMPDLSPIASYCQDVNAEPEPEATDTEDQ